jgi:hypothetical protein
VSLEGTLYPWIFLLKTGGTLHLLLKSWNVLMSIGWVKYFILIYPQVNRRVNISPTWFFRILLLPFKLPYLAGKYLRLALSLLYLTRIHLKFSLTQ